MRRNIFKWLKRKFVSQFCGCPPSVECCRRDVELGSANHQEEGRRHRFGNLGSLEGGFIWQLKLFSVSVCVIINSDYDVSSILVPHKDNLCTVTIHCETYAGNSCLLLAQGDSVPYQGHEVGFSAVLITFM
jgi:hypothetical protein